jgi:hypothetical protein
MLLHTIKTNDNAADNMTKSLVKQLFNRHVDTIMGRRVPPQFLRSNPPENPEAHPGQNPTSLRGQESETLSHLPRHGGDVHAYSKYVA